MKKRFTFVFVFLISLMLAACGEVGNTKEAISAIGTVTMESETAICHAETLFDDLSPRQQKRVKNKDVLIAARAEYTRLTQEVEQTITAITALDGITLADRQELENTEAQLASLTENQREYITNADALTAAREEFERQAGLVKKAVDSIENLGEITLSSQSALLAARQAYSEAEKEGLAVYIQHVYTILANAEARYVYLSLEVQLNAARNMFMQGMYDAALEQAQALITECQKNDLLSSAKTLAADCFVALAQQAFEANDLESAFCRLHSSDEFYPTEERPDSYILLQQKITAALEQCRPANGKVLKSKRAYDPYANHKVTVQAPTDSDVCVRLERVGNADMYVVFYIRAGEKATISVYHGKYYIKYALGEHWFGEDSYFGENGVYIQANEPFEFYFYRQGNYEYHVGLSLTIGYSIDGDTDGTEIPREAF